MSKGEEYSRRLSEFAKAVKLPTKSHGIVRLGDVGLTTPQKIFIWQVGKAIDAGCNVIVCVKGRQEGISSINEIDILRRTMSEDAILALAITHTAETMEARINDLHTIYDNLDPAWKIEMKIPKGKQGAISPNFRFKNSSVLRVIKKSSQLREGEEGELGRGTGLSHIWATEVGSWKTHDMKNIQNLKTTIRGNPRALFILEGTPKGKNIFYELWNEAQRVKSQYPMFIAWWACPEYRIDSKLEKKEFKKYYNEVTKLEWEDEVIAKIKEFSGGYELTPEQIAFYRMLYYEDMGKNMIQLFREYPPTPELGFSLSGGQIIADELENMRMTRKFPLAMYDVEFKTDKIGEVNEVVFVRSLNEEAHLKVFEEPNPNYHYIIGVDPAWGMSDPEDCYFAIEVLKAIRDPKLEGYGVRCEEVASYAKRHVFESEGARTIFQLATMYKGKDEHACINIEINGLGKEILRRLTDQYMLWNFFYWSLVKTDKIQKGKTTSDLCWLTRQDTKQQMLAVMVDMIKNGTLKIHDEDLIDQCDSISYMAEYVIESSYTDKCMALGLALMCQFMPLIYYDNDEYNKFLEDIARSRTIALMNSPSDNKKIFISAEDFSSLWRKKGKIRK